MSVVDLIVKLPLLPETGSDEYEKWIEQDDFLGFLNWCLHQTPFLRKHAVTPDVCDLTTLFARP